MFVTLIVIDNVVNFEKVTSNATAIGTLQYLGNGERYDVSYSIIY